MTYTNLTKEQIEKLNTKIYNKCGYGEQGVYSEPFGIPDKEKRLVIYMRYETGGVSGGSCWDDSDPQPYSNSDDNKDFIALDVFLTQICPNITFLQFREIERLIHSNYKTKWEYYGNQTNYEIKYIVIEEIFKYLENI